jgi:hypothetical protein
MSNVNPKDILTGIESTLTASPTLVNSSCLQAVVIGRDADHSGGFPFCRIYLDTFDNPIADTVSYERTYTFAVEIWQEMTAKSKRNAELDLANALHLVLNRLSGTWQLGLGVEGLTITGGPVRSVELNGGPMIVAPITVTVTDLIQNPA